MKFKKLFIKSSFLIVLVPCIIIFLKCEGDERFYRPNMPEKLCSVGIIDADDTSDYNIIPEPLDNRTSLRFISFEKSYQAEYAGEENDSLRHFEFIISSLGYDVFKFKSDSTIKDLKELRIPNDIDFRSGIYQLVAREQNFPEISAEITVPEPPSKPELISLNKETITLPVPTECIGFTTAKAATIDFSFKRNDNHDLYYAILLTGNGSNLSSTWPLYKSQLEFTVRYCNTSGFFAILPGCTMYQWTCKDVLVMIKVPVYAYFIDGSKIPANKCIVKISTQFEDEHSPFDFLKSLQVRLLSVPKVLFNFEKSLYTYKQTIGDPFTEPIYLNGNIKGGHGVFAICRSSEFSLVFSPWY